VSLKFRLKCEWWLVCLTHPWKNCILCICFLFSFSLFSVGGFASDICISESPIIWQIQAHAKYYINIHQVNVRIGEKIMISSNVHFHTAQGTLNDNCSKMVKATNFTIKTHDPKDSPDPDTTSEKFFVKGCSKDHVTTKFFGDECQQLQHSLSY